MRAKSDIENLYVNSAGRVIYASESVCTMSLIRRVRLTEFRGRKKVRPVEYQKHLFLIYSVGRVIRCFVDK